MTLQPILDASFAVQLHVAAATAAFVLGAAILFRRKGDRRHRLAGRVWVALMLVTAISTAWIHEIRLWGMWSPIHLVSIGTVVALGLAVWHARAGRVRRHRLTMQATFAGALIVAGLLSFLPGRIMHAVAFGAG